MQIMMWCFYWIRKIHGTNHYYRSSFPSCFVLRSNQIFIESHWMECLFNWLMKWKVSQFSWTFDIFTVGNGKIVIFRLNARCNSYVFICMQKCSSKQTLHISGEMFGSCIETNLIFLFLREEESIILSFCKFCMFRKTNI